MYKIKSYFTKKLDDNLAFHVGDKINNVKNNRKKLALKYKFEINNLRSMNQTHSSNIQIIDHKSDLIIDDCDALITSEKDICLLVMVADCIAILIKDERKGILAAVHAGRSGTFLNISSKVVNKMINEFGCEIKDIKVEFSPSIQKCCYEVNNEIIEFVKKTYGEEFIFNNNISLQDINKKLLEDLGIENIKISNICTKCSNEDYFSYRKDKNCGRFAGIIFSSKE